MNAFSYALNSPVLFKDPSGLNSIESAPPSPLRLSDLGLNAANGTPNAEPASPRPEGGGEATASVPRFGKEQKTWEQLSGHEKWVQAKMDAGVPTDFDRRVNGESILEKLGKTTLFVLSMALTGPAAVAEAGPVRIEQVLATSRTQVGRTTAGVRALAKKLGHAERGGYKSAFDGIKPTQENAESVTRSVLSDPARTVVGEKTTDVYNSVGQGVRVDTATNEFRGFLESELATR